MNAIRLLLSHRSGSLLAGVRRCETGWHGRLILWPLFGAPEVHECPAVDVSESIALHRACVLAELQYPERSLH